MRKVKTLLEVPKHFVGLHPISCFLSILLFAIVFIFSYQSPPVQAAAVTCYWVGDTSPASWNDATHWSSSSGGAGSTCDSGVVPGSDDIATFTSLNTNNANVDAAVNVKGIAINAGYTGTISQDAGQTVAIGSSGFVQADGIYSATEIMTLTGGPFTKSGGTFNEGTGTLTLSGTITYNVNATEDFYDVTKVSTSAVGITAGDTMVVLHTLTLTDGSFNTGTIDTRGDTNQAATFDGGTTILDFGAAGVQTYTLNGGGIGPHLRLDNPDDASDFVNFTTANAGFYGLTILAAFGANTVPINYNGFNMSLGLGGYTQEAGTFNAPTTFTLGGSFTHTVGGTFNEGTNTIITFANTARTFNVNTSETFNNLEFNITYFNGSWTITAGQTMIVTGTLTFTGPGYLASGTIDARGNINQAAASTGGGTTILDFGDDAVVQTYSIAGGAGPILNFDDPDDVNDIVNFTADGGLSGLDIDLAFGANDVPMVYNAHNLTIYSSGYTQDAGNFTAPAALTLISSNFTKSGGVFNEGNGTVTFSSDNTVYDVDTTETFYNVILNKANTVKYLTIAAGDTMVVGGDLTLTQGYINGGAVVLLGNATQSVNMSYSTCTIDFGNDAVNQTYTINGGFSGIMQFDDPDDANDIVRFNADSGFFGLNIEVGFGANDVPMEYNGYALVVYTDGYNQDAGNFTAPSSMTIRGAALSPLGFIKTGGTFNEGIGTVTFTTTSATGNVAYDVVASETFYDVTFNVTGAGAGVTLAVGDTMVVSHTLNLTYGYAKQGTLDAQGDVTVTSNFSTASTTLLKFSGGATQSFNLTGATGNFNSDITVDKSGGQVNLVSALLADAANQDLTITQGVFDLNGNALTVNGGTGKLIVQNTGTLQLQGGEAITANATYPQLDTGSTVSYDGTAGPYNIKNYTYSNLTVAGAATTFNQVASTVVGANLTVSAGILDATGTIIIYRLGVAGTRVAVPIMRKQIRSLLMEQTKPLPDHLPLIIFRSRILPTMRQIEPFYLIIQQLRQLMAY